MITLRFVEHLLRCCTTQCLCLKSLPHKPQQNCQYCLIVLVVTHAMLRRLTSWRCIIIIINHTSMQISLKSVQTFELSHSHSHRNTQTRRLCTLYKHVHLVGPRESQRSLLFYKSYTQHGIHQRGTRTHTQDS